MTDVQSGPAGTHRSVVTDIDIPFGRLVAIFIKFGLAAIPAAIIVAIIWAIILALLTAIFGAGLWSTGMFDMMNRGI
jgi:hypothetical protein